MSANKLSIEMTACGVPEHMHDGLWLWINNGIWPGSFLTAVICNDLRESVAKADHINVHRLKNFIEFFYNYAPSACWGSQEKAEAWAEHRHVTDVDMCGVQS